MKKILSWTLLLLATIAGKAQNMEGEVVDWDSLPSFSANSFHFENEEIEFNCKNCKYLEIKSASGVSGFYVVGAGTMLLKKKNISDIVSGCMIRLNPSDIEAFIKIKGKKKAEDSEFVTASLPKLKSTFKHCYHSNMDALIPEKGKYALNFFGEKYKDLLTSKDDEKLIIYSFSDRKKL